MDNKQKLFTKKEAKRIRNIAYVITFCAFINVIYFFLYQMIDAIKVNFYLKHFCIPLSLLLVGVMALLMGYSNARTSYRNSVKNDKYIYVAGIVLIFAGIVACIGSFL